MRAVFVGGTDTGCGKTTVTRTLAIALRNCGRQVRVFKPVETGCKSTNGELRPLDALALAEAARDPRPIDRICAYALPLPSAPVVAAQDASSKLDLSWLDACFREAREHGDIALIEAAGGLRVPLDDDTDMLELARRWNAPLLLVARARLGTINHTLLSLGEAERRGVEVLGVVICHDTPTLSAPDRQNLGWLLANCPAPILGELPHLGPVPEEPNPAIAHPSPAESTLLAQGTGSLRAAIDLILGLGELDAASD